MKLHRFYTASRIEKGEINSLSDLSLVHQIANVLRLRVWDKAIFFDGSGNEYETEIVSLEKDSLEFRVLETRQVKQHSLLKLSLAFSLIKKDNIEWIIQKCTELGVSEFIPLISERSEKKGFNLERAKKIVIEACEQSGRGDVPAIHEPMRLDNFLQDEKRKMIFFHMSGDYFKREDIKDLKELVACVGPEGGWSEKEISMFKEKGASLVSLNAPVLRAETAAVATSTLLLL